MARLVAPFIKPVGKTEGRAAFAECIPPTPLLFLITRGSGAASPPSPLFLFLSLLVLRPEDAALLLVLSVSRYFVGFMILLLGA